MLIGFLKNVLFDVLVVDPSLRKMLSKRMARDEPKSKLADFDHLCIRQPQLEHKHFEDLDS